MRVYYPYDDATLMRNYMSNAQVFAEIDEILSSGVVPSLEIISYSSPEGDWNYNLRLSRRRANSLRRYLERNYPELAGNVTINPDAEAWGELRNLVSSDSRLSESSRNAIFEIIDSDLAPDVKERKLRSMEGYRKLYKNFFRGLRYAQISVVGEAPKVAASGTDGLGNADENVANDPSATVISVASENAENSVYNAETADLASNENAAVSGSAATASVSTTGHGAVTSVAGAPVVYFHSGEDFIRLDYKNNEANLKEIARMISSGEIADYSIAGFSSPEGSVKANENLSYRRALAIRNYLVNEFPELKDKLVIVNGGENWSALREQVVNGNALTESEKAAVLSIIDSNDDPQTKEARLMRSSSYRAIARKYFPNIRCASFVTGTNAVTGSNAVTGTSDNAGTSAGDNVGDNAGSEAGVPMVYFVSGEDNIRLDYKNNINNLNELGRMFVSGELPDYTIAGYTSPEGNVKDNADLGFRRAMAIKEYLEKAFPELQGKLKVVDGGENWEALREMVVSGNALTESEKEQVLSIIDSDDDADTKEARLRRTTAYRKMAHRYFPYIRGGSFAKNSGDASDKAGVGEDHTGKDDNIDNIGNNDNTGNDGNADLTITEPADTTGNADITITEPVDTTATTPVDTTLTGSDIFGKTRKVYYEPQRMLAALKTNLLYDAVTALNFEVEVPIGKRYSVMVEDVFPWWETGNKYCFQMWEIGIEPRYWFKSWDVESSEKLRGFFVGPYVMSSKYDFQNDTKLNYQGEYWSAGLSGGYSMPIGTAFNRYDLNMEFSLSVGYMHTDYRHYLPADDYSMLIRDLYNIGKVSYFGPTKAKVSLVLTLPARKKEVRYE